MTGLGPGQWLAVMLACVVFAAAVTVLFAWLRFGSGGAAVRRALSRWTSHRTGTDAHGDGR